MSTQHASKKRSNRKINTRRTQKPKSDLWRPQNMSRKPGNRWVGIPAQTDKILHYSNMGKISGAAVNVSTNFAINSNAPNGGNAPAEFSNWATMYDFYRPVACTMHLSMANAETFPVSVGYAFTTENPGTSTSYDELMAERICGRSQFLLNHTFKPVHIKYSNIVGSDAVETADSYRAIINSSPADTVWLTLGVFSPTSANLTNGATYQLDLYISIRFYNADLTLQQSPPATKAYLDALVARRESLRALHKLERETQDAEKLAIIQKQIVAHFAPPPPLLKL